jgi:hypothetical protein
MRKLVLVILSIAVASCGSAPQREDEAQAEEKTHTGKIVGATGGGAIGAAVGWSQAGVLCTISGPLCAIVVVPVAIFGGLIGGAAGSIGDAVKDARANQARQEANQERREASEKSAQPRADTSARPGG